MSAVDLPALAAIWVERWLAYGGGLVVDKNRAGLSMSMRMDLWRWKHGHASQRHWHDGWHTGRWRELQELANLIPGLREAIVDYVSDHGTDGGRGQIHMWEQGAHVGWQNGAKATAAN